jgi:hypothetical protein
VWGQERAVLNLRAIGPRLRRSDKLRGGEVCRTRLLDEVMVMAGGF